MEESGALTPQRYETEEWQEESLMHQAPDVDTAKSRGLQAGGKGSRAERRKGRQIETLCGYDCN